MATATESTRNEAPADHRRRYVDNLAALYAVDSTLAAAVETVPFQKLEALEPARDGNWTLRVPSDDGPLVYAHSRHRPVDEARALIAPHVSEERVTYVICGGGLGYVIDALEQARTEPTVLVCEDDLALIKACLCLHDLAERLRDRRVVFLSKADRIEVHRLLTPINAAIMLGTTLIQSPLAQRRSADFHRRLTALIGDFASYVKTQLLTLVRTSRTTFRNLSLNLPAYLHQPGVETLRGRATGYPAIVVAAGPSLTLQLDRLRDVQDRAVIVCVQTVYRLLLKLGIRPHFVTSLDFHEVSAEFFRDLPSDAPGRLVAEPKATHLVLDAFPGPRFVLDHPLHRTLLGGAAAPRGSMSSGSTVAHLAMYLARHLGCDPIIFIGQDLAFSDNVFYLPGSPVEDIWAPEMNRFNTVETRHWERIARNRSILKRVEDVNGRPILSDDLLLTYAEQFACEIEQTTARIIQAGGRGMRLPGAESLELDAAAERFCTRTLPDGLFDATPHAQVDLRRVETELSNRIEEVRSVRDIAHETAGLLKKLEGLLDRPAEFNRLIARVDGLRTAMGRHDAVYKLIVDVSARANLQRYSADRAIGGGRQETTVIAQARLRRDRAFVEALIEGCDYVLDVLPQARARLTEDRA